ncbi:Peptidase_M16 domain-containing protein/Peptidase_M16_C domain-containing protein, partial [Cephalotus follicularis]
MLYRSLRNAARVKSLITSLNCPRTHEQKHSPVERVLQSRILQLPSPITIMYRTAASRLRVHRGRTVTWLPTRYASSTAVAPEVSSSSFGGLFGWLTGGRTKTSPPLDFPLPGVALPPTLPDYVEPSKTKITTLPNGVQIASEKSPSPVASIGLYVDCGSIYESPISCGATHLLERMAFKSTQNRSHLRVVREAEAIGGSVQAAASREHMVYTFEALKTYVPEMVELLVDCVRNPAFLDWEINEELLKVKEEISEASKNPDGFLLEAIHSAGYSGALSNPLLAPESAIKRLNSTILEEFVAENYTAPRMVLAAYGVEHEELLSIAEPLLSDLPGVPRPQVPKSVYTGGDYRCHDADTGGKTHFALAFELPGGWQKEKEAMTLTVLQMLMGGGGSFSAGGPGKGMYSRLCVYAFPLHHSKSRHEAEANIPHRVNNSAKTKTKPSNFLSIYQALSKHLYTKSARSLRYPAAKKAQESTKNDLLASISTNIMLLLRKPVEHFLKIVDEVTVKDIASISQKLLSSPLTMASYGDVINVPSYDSVRSKFKLQ